MNYMKRQFFLFIFAALFGLLSFNATAFAQVATGKEAVLDERYPQPEVKFASGVIIPDVDHSFIGKTPEATHAATNQALKKTLEFIDAILGGKAK